VNPDGSYDRLVSDRLLWTRRRKARDAALKLSGALAPVALLVLLVVATGGRATAIAVGVFGALVALVVAADVRTPRGALIGGTVIALVLLALQIAVAWLIDHPILD
jgi:hypothetical protein